MEEIRWSEEAKDDLVSIHEHISQHSAFNANRQLDNLVSRVKQLQHFPNSGRIMPDFNDTTLRELIEGRYRIVYELHDDGISIVRIVHSSRQIKTMKQWPTDDSFC